MADNYITNHLWYNSYGYGLVTITLSDEDGGKQKLRYALRDDYPRPKSVRDRFIADVWLHSALMPVWDIEIESHRHADELPNIFAEAREIVEHAHIVNAVARAILSVISQHERLPRDLYMQICGQALERASIVTGVKEALFANPIDKWADPEYVRHIIPVLPHKLQSLLRHWLFVTYDTRRLSEEGVFDEI